MIDLTQKDFDEYKDIRLGLSFEDLNKQKEFKGRKQVMYIQVPLIGLLYDSNFAKVLDNYLKGLKKKYKNLDYRTSVHTELWRFSEPMKEIILSIKKKEVDTLIIQGFEQICNNPFALKQLIDICEANDVDIVDFKGKSLISTKKERLLLEMVVFQFIVEHGSVGSDETTKNRKSEFEK
ncbi:MAG: hypothetical protein J6K75_03575 [Erysipelotrichaceae bacterium]|nr:hypothetical protein [Erysipelotrichaceae bacterium]